MGKKKTGWGRVSPAPYLLERSMKDQILATVYKDMNKQLKQARKNSELTGTLIFLVIKYGSILKDEKVTQIVEELGLLPSYRIEIQKIKMCSKIMNREGIIITRPSKQI